MQIIKTPEMVGGIDIDVCLLDVISYCYPCQDEVVNGRCHFKHHIYIVNCKSVFVGFFHFVLIIVFSKMFFVGIKSI